MEYAIKKLFNAEYILHTVINKAHKKKKFVKSGKSAVMISDYFIIFFFKWLNGLSDTHSKHTYRQTDRQALMISQCIKGKLHSVSSGIWHNAIFVIRGIFTTPWTVVTRSMIGCWLRFLFCRGWITCLLFWLFILQ